MVYMDHLKLMEKCLKMKYIWISLPIIIIGDVNECFDIICLLELCVFNCYPNL